MTGDDCLALPSEESVACLARNWNLTEEAARRRRDRELQSANGKLSSAPDMKKAALWYARNGVPVFPLHNPIAGGCSCGKQDCDKPGKHPRTLHGFKDATTDEGRVSAWWDAHPDANIGVPTGVLTGLLLVDADPRNGGPADRSELIDLLGRIPETAEAVTDGDGRHIYFRYSGGPVPRHLTKGIDLKGDGGYAVLPPSLHFSGKRYEWDGAEGAKAILHPAEAPAWLLEFIRRKQAGTEVRRASELPATIPDGTKHYAIVSLAGTLRRRGASEAVTFAACRALNFQSPVSDADVWTRVRSVYGLYPADTRNGLKAYANGNSVDADLPADTEPEPESKGASVTSVTGSWPEIIPLVGNLTDPIPASCLPAWLGEMATAVSESTETPFEMAALLALAVVASCVAAKADVSPEPGYSEPLNLYLCPAMESGNRKTSVFSRLLAPLIEWERMEANRIEPVRKRLLSEQRTAEARIDHLRKEVRTIRGPSGDDPRDSATRNRAAGSARVPQAFF